MNRDLMIETYEVQWLNNRNELCCTQCKKEFLATYIKYLLLYDASDISVRLKWVQPLTTYIN